jgi:hypothetical protein
MQEHGTLVVAHLIKRTSAAMTPGTGDTSRLMKLMLQTQGGPIPVFN